MPNHQIYLKLVPLKLENSEKIKSIRLVSENSRIHIASLTGGEHRSEHLVSATAISGDKTISPPPRLLFNLDSPFGVPSWDITNGQTGLASVWTKPQSASMPLGFRKHGSDEIILAGREPMGVFYYPRFVRGAAQMAITAIMSSRVVAFFNELESGHAKYTPLPIAKAGTIIDGLLLQQGSGYLLITKHLFAGPRGPWRKDISGESVSPGILRCIRLNAKFQQVGTTMSPIGDIDVFEFDADIAGDKVFLFATTTDGYMAAVATGPNEGLQWTRTDDIMSDYDLFSPSVLVNGKTAMAAVIESDKVDHTQLLIGDFKF